MSALGELILGCRRRGWRVGLHATPTDSSRLTLRAVEVRDRDRELLARAPIVVDDLEAASVRAAIILEVRGLLA